MLKEEIKFSKSNETMKKQEFGYLYISIVYKIRIFWYLI